MLGERIAALRKAAGMSQAQLAGRLRISASAVGMYEQGRREPSAQLLVAIGREFGVTVDYLLTGAEGICRRDSLEHRLEECLRAADRRLEKREPRPFSREELAVLFAAMLAEG